MSKFGQKYSEERKLTILRRLAPFGTMNMLELGFTATPQAVRNLAAGGLLKVTVTLTPRGQEMLDKLEVQAKRRAVRTTKQANEAAKVEAA